MYTTKYYWDGDKGVRARYALQHTEEMEQKYASEIADAIRDTITYDNQSTFDLGTGRNPRMSISLLATDTIDAIVNYTNGHAAVLNFASYKKPGGEFLRGSRAQEESLCAGSYLYNILRKQPEYYKWNAQNLNGCMYKNRALYSPSVRFFKDGKETRCDVITCAAPNISGAQRSSRNITAAENTKALEERIEFIIKIAVDKELDTLVLGAFGCGGAMCC